MSARSLCAALAALAGAAHAAAQSAEASRELGDVHYAHGDYPAALPLFESAWAAGRAPPDLLRVGRCRFKLGDSAGAKDALFQFLQLDPESPLAAEAFGIISAIEIAEKQAAPPPPRGLGLARKAALGAGGLAVALASVASVFGLQARATNREIGSQPHPRAELEPLRDQLWRQAGRANSFFVAGGAALAAGGVLWAVDF